MLILVPALDILIVYLDVPPWQFAATVLWVLTAVLAFEEGVAVPLESLHSESHQDPISLSEKA